MLAMFIVVTFILKSQRMAQPPSLLVHDSV